MGEVVWFIVLIRKNSSSLIHSLQASPYPDVDDGLSMSTHSQNQQPPSQNGGRSAEPPTVAAACFLKLVPGGR
jgi:hypothetical protein